MWIWLYCLVFVGVEISGDTWVFLYTNVASSVQSSTVYIVQAINNLSIISCFQKITTKNAFGLHLIDFMSEILKQKDTEPTNFKVRRMCTLISELMIISNVQSNTTEFCKYLRTFSTRHCRSYFTFFPQLMKCREHKCVYFSSVLGVFLKFFSWANKYFNKLVEFCLFRVLFSASS